MDKAAARASFAAWKETVPEFLTDAKSLFPSAKRKQLNLKADSLDLIESWILSQFPNTETVLSGGHAQTINLLACYVGETFIKSIGGEWDIQLDDHKRAFFNIPVVVCAGEIVCPLSLVTASAD